MIIKLEFLFIFFILSTSVFGVTSMNFLTKGQADTLYCQVDGTCVLSELTVGNLSVIGEVFNVTVTNVYLNLSFLQGETWVNESGDTMTGNLSIPSTFTLDVTNIISRGGGNVNVRDNMEVEGFLSVGGEGGFLDMASNDIFDVDEIQLNTIAPNEFEDNVTVNTNLYLLDNDINDVGNLDVSAIIGGGTGHDQFSDFVANEHIDWTSATQDFKTTGSGTYDDEVIINNDHNSVDHTLTLKGHGASPPTGGLIKFLLGSGDLLDIFLGSGVSGIYIDTDELTGSSVINALYTFGSGSAVGFQVQENPIVIKSDDYGFIHGRGKDASIIYNGTDRNFDSAVVGSGEEHFLQNVNMRKGLDVIDNVTAENIFLPQEIFLHTNATLALDVANQWFNISFDHHEDLVKKGITHTFDDGTNDTITINQSGNYMIHYSGSFIDESPSPTSNFALRLIKNGTEVMGSVIEYDTSRQSAETELGQGIITSLSAGDRIKLQAIADDTDVSITTHGTFGDNPETTTLSMFKISNP